jgi:GAF domain-containing protein
MGRLTLHREEGRAWSNDEIELIKSVALQATMAADNARLIEQAQIALHESEALYQAASEISGATDLQGICQHVTNSINDLVHADRTTMFLVDRDRKRILFSTGSGNIGDALQMTYAELTSGISGRVLHSGQPVLSLSADDGIEPEETRERRRQSDIGALIIVPLNIKGQVFGTVTAINRCNQPEFTQHDAELLTAFAAQAATAIDNVRLLAETRQRAEREQLIRQITTRIRAAGDIQGVLEVTAAELARSMGVPRAIVRLTMGDST